MKKSLQTSTLTLVTALIAIGSPLLASAQNNYAAFELRRQDNWGAIHIEDMNGDGRKDIVVPHFNPSLGRELHIYWQQADGGFNSELTAVEIKSEIIAVGFADLRDEPGSELILYANNGIFSLSPAQSGYANNLRLLAEWDYLATIPEREEVLFVHHHVDIDADGVLDLLVPGDDLYGIFIGSGEEQFTLTSQFSTLNPELTAIQRRSLEADLEANLGISAERGIVVELEVETPTPFYGFIEQFRANTVEDDRALLRSEQWQPTATLARLNGDDALDISYINAGDDGLGRMNIHFGAIGGAYGESADWQQDLDSSGQLQLLDLDGDGLDDLLRLNGNGDDWTAYLYRNLGGSFNLRQPDQIMRFSGYDVDLNLIQLDTDTRVLAASYYTIPVVDALRNASINRVQLLYASASTDSQDFFSRRPDSRLEESFSAENVRGLSEQMSLLYDVDGDGRNDALYITDNGTLAARRIGQNLSIAAEPFWEYVSPRTVFEFEVLALNNDMLPDLILRHGNSTTLLVARP